MGKIKTWVIENPDLALAASLGALVGFVLGRHVNYRFVTEAVDSVLSGYHIEIKIPENFRLEL